jgi:hypothetical protein
LQTPVHLCLCCCYCCCHATNNTRRFDTAEEAAADPALPASLHTKVRAMPWPPEVRDITDSAEMELEEDHGCKGRCRACMMRSGYSSDSGDNYGWY